MFYLHWLFSRRNELVNVNEQKQKEALQMFYERDSLKQRNEKRIVRLKNFSRVINPLICVGFVIVFWAVGMQHYYQQIQIERIRIGNTTLVLKTHLLIFLSLKGSHFYLQFLVSKSREVCAMFFFISFDARKYSLYITAVRGRPYILRNHGWGRN